MRARLLLAALPAFGGVAACSVLFDLSDIAPTPDVSDAQAQSDASPDTLPADDSFTLTATPSHVTQDPGDGTDVAVSITRGATFSDIVDVTVNGVGGLSGIQTSPATLTFTASAPLTLHLDVDGTAKTPQDGVITLIGIGRSTKKSSPASFGVRIGSVLLDTTTSTTFSVPSYVHVVGIKAWGAGGGAGGPFTDSTNASAAGGRGGGGGMAGAFFAVTPGEMLTVVAGGIGMNAGSGGGSGGGYSAVLRGGQSLLVAGAGGGGSGAVSSADVYCYASPGADGAAGGGGKPQPSPDSATLTAGGPAGGLKATAGIALIGGDGADPKRGGGADGGAPGGGAGRSLSICGGATGGGGGGGGWFGGGGGGVSGGLMTTSAGGGGSGYVSDAGMDASAQAGSGPNPASDPDYRMGTATGGMSYSVPATPGRVLVRAPKP